MKKESGFSLLLILIIFATIGVCGYFVYLWGCSIDLCDKRSQLSSTKEDFENDNNKNQPDNANWKIYQGFGIVFRYLPTVRIEDQEYLVQFEELNEPGRRAKFFYETPTHTISLFTITDDPLYIKNPHKLLRCGSHENLIPNGSYFMDKTGCLDSEITNILIGDRKAEKFSIRATDLWNATIFQTVTQPVIQFSIEEYRYEGEEIFTEITKNILFE